MIKWLFDRVVSLLGLLVLLPFFLVIGLVISLDSRGGVFFVQKRVGKHEKLFGMYKFRTMRPFSEKGGKLTVGARDPRITRVGFFLRKYKLDELPQLINVLKGEMSFVGPRPEVPDYVALYSDEQRLVFSILPGITDYASLHYFHESELLAKSTDPHRTYVEEVMPAKLSLNLEYLRNRSFFDDLKVIGLTVQRIFTSSK